MFLAFLQSNKLLYVSVSTKVLLVFVRPVLERKEK